MPISLIRAIRSLFLEDGVVNDVLDFFEEVAVGGAVLVQEGEGAVRGDTGNARHETVARCVLVGVLLAVVAIKGRHVLPVQVAAGGAIVE